MSTPFLFPEVEEGEFIPAYHDLGFGEEVAGCTSPSGEFEECANCIMIKKCPLYEEVV